MSARRTMTLALAAGLLTLGGAYGAHELALSRANPIVVQRFLLGYHDRKGRFVAVAGRGATNVDRNAIVMFVFSGAVDAGPDIRATLPLTLAEQAELEAELARDPDFDPRDSGFEPGVIPRKRSEDRAAFLVASGSVSADSVEIAVPTGTGQTQARGVFFKPLRPRGRAKASPRRILFNPRYVAATFNRPGEIDYNPEGLEPLTTYTVTLEGGGGADPFRSVRNREGLPLAAPFSTTFVTSDRYVQDFTRPQLRTTNPTDGTINVASDADIELDFNEPMDASTFTLPRFQGDDQWTMNVRYTQSPQNGQLAGRNVLGVVRVKPQTGGNVIQFRPLQGFGKGPYEVEVIVTAAVTDLSGNNIIRQFQFVFTTQNDPSAEEFGFLEETFETNAQQDLTYLPSGDNLSASWDSAGKPGLLTTSVAESVVDARASTNSNLDTWYTAPIVLHMLFPSKDMGPNARTFVGFSWEFATISNLTYPNTQVRMGHANDLIASGGFTAAGPVGTNFRDTPVLVTTAAPYTIGTPNGAYIAGPPWTKNFNYDGQNSVILELSHGGNGGTAGERWRIDNLYSINVTTYSIPSLALTSARTWYHSTRFHYLTPGAEAQSLWYDSGRNDARFLPQQIVPVVQPNGTAISFQWQAAKADASGTQLDQSSITPWNADVRVFANYRYLRFRASLVNNLTARTSPAVDLLTLPYTFR